MAPPKGDLTCFNCGKEVGDDFYCYGCKKCICDECDVSCGEYPQGSHQPGDHLVAPEERDAS